MKSGTLILLAVVLLTALGLQFSSLGQAREARIEVDLSSVLPESPLGWASADLPIGDTEFMAESVEKRLNFDSFVFRRYSRGQDDISVYAAYWGPGRMDTRLVASHTPDRCWVENGWKCTDKVFNKALDLPDMVTKPAQERTFYYAGNGSVSHVYYWHLVGDRVYDYGERLNSFPHPGKYLRDFVVNLRHGKPEQYFIRISSSIPTGQLLDEPLFQDIVMHLRAVGLEQPAAL